MSDSLTRPSFMEWPTDILDEIWYLVRLDLRAGLKKRLWATVHSDLVSAARWNIATQHSQRLWGEYDRTLLDEEEGEEEYEDVVTTPPAITLFACERWVLHHPYALAEGAAWWPHTTIESQVGEAIPATARRKRTTYSRVGLGAARCPGRAGTRMEASRLVAVVGVRRERGG